MAAFFTKGPWGLQGSYGNDRVGVGVADRLVASVWTKEIVGNREYADSAEGEANAILIAAAPDLYRVLTEVRDWIRYELEAGTPNATVKLRSVIAALAKASPEGHLRQAAVTAAPDRALQARIIKLEGALERIATVDMGGGFLGAQACREVARAALANQVSA